MTSPDRFELSRRALLLARGAAVLAACTSDGDPDTARPAGGTSQPPATRTGTPTGAAAPTTLPPTPSCTDDDETPEQTEGPFFSSGSLRALHCESARQPATWGGSSPVAT